MFSAYSIGRIPEMALLDRGNHWNERARYAGCILIAFMTSAGTLGGSFYWRGSLEGARELYVSSSPSEWSVLLPARGETTKTAS